MNFKTYKIKENENEFLPLGFMNYEMIRQLFHVYAYEQEYDDIGYDVMKNNPSYYGYVSIELSDNYGNEEDFDNFELFIDNEFCYEISSKYRKIKQLNNTYLNTIRNTKIKLEPLIINTNNKVLIKKELLNICKYDNVYEILKFI